MHRCLALLQMEQMEQLLVLTRTTEVAVVVLHLAVGEFRWVLEAHRLELEVQRWEQVEEQEQLRSEWVERPKEVGVAQDHLPAEPEAKEW